ncbi:MAG: serpin family protein [Planctomycetes bacterium]|nr:serpin family protein [Planctomycetota bacterium]
MRLMPTSFLLACFAITGAAPQARAQAEADAKTLAAACNQFAADLHAKLAVNGPPTCSPTSIAMALTMLLPGARGTTADELRTALHLPAEFTGTRLHAAAARLLDDLGIRTPRQDAESTQLQVTNDLWTARELKAVPAFAAVLRESFAAGHHTVDFAGDPPAALATINRHVAKATRDRIPELLTPDLVTRDTRVVLTNTIWLKAAWLHAFAERGTRPAPFHLDDGSTAEVPTMAVADEFGYAESDAWQCVVLPFDDSSLGFELVLPKAGTTLVAAEAALLRGEPGQKAAETRVLVKLPRFKIAAAHRLRAVLQELGVRTAFGAGADFSGIAAERLMVDDVVHQTWIQVDEKGCEAAGATAVVLKRGGRAGKAIEFVADRPFAFTLRDRRTGLVLFVGRVVDPRQAPDAAAPAKSAGTKG